jgi:hypothetical protein
VFSRRSVEVQTFAKTLDSLRFLCFLKSEPGDNVSLTAHALDHLGAGCIPNTLPTSWRCLHSSINLPFNFSLTSVLVERHQRFAIMCALSSPSPEPRQRLLSAAQTSVIPNVSLKNAVENHFTAKPQRAQRTYNKIKLHPFGEAIDHLDFDSNLCFSWRLCALAVEV